LAITLSPGGDLEIYTLDLAAQVLTRLTNDPSIDTEPMWSNDGQKIYFMSDRAGGPQIYEINVDNPRQVRRLTHEGNYNARPRVSPDGKKLAFMHREGSDDRIAVLDLSTNALQVLTQGHDDESPSFAPNGAILIYATHARGRGVLATVSVDGRVQTTLASSSGEVQEPVWSPYPPK
jgi:TolB protein